MVGSLHLSILANPSVVIPFVCLSTPNLVFLLHLTLAHSFLQVAKHPCDETKKKKKESCKSIHNLPFLSVLSRKILLLSKAEEFLLGKRKARSIKR